MAGENYARVANERNQLLDCLVAVDDWIEANKRLVNTAYKGDARKECDRTREIYLGKMAEVRPLIDQRRNGGQGR